MGMKGDLRLGTSECSKTGSNSRKGYAPFFLAVPHGMKNFAHQESNPPPLQWKPGVLTTGLPGKPYVPIFVGRAPSPYSFPLCRFLPSCFL